MRRDVNLKGCLIKPRTSGYGSCNRGMLCTHLIKDLGQGYSVMNTVDVDDTIYNLHSLE